jgi:spore coat polysaccharide biosynthesis predicted glycosyltransferase SpsG
MTGEVIVHPNTGNDVGLGHLVRGMTLTEELQSRDVATQIRLKADDEAVEFARDAGLEPLVSPADELHDDLCSSPADIVVVDSYEFSTGDFRQVGKGRTLVVIDELGDRPIPAERVLNTNIYADDVSYPAATEVLRGTEYCMLREDFRQLPPPTYPDPPETVLVTVGGADLADAFSEILDIPLALSGTVAVDAIVGPYFDSPDGVPGRVTFHDQPSNIHTLMWEADVAVSGGGQTLYELAACGTPTAALTLGSDQVRNIDGFREAGFCRSVGRPSDQLFAQTLRKTLTALVTNHDMRREMGQQGRSLVDGNGVVRVADRLQTLV